MSWKKYEDDCPGCYPALLDPTTMEPCPPNHPAALRVRAVWKRTSRETKEAFHRFTCLNSRDPRDVALVQALARAFSDEPS